MKLPPNPDLTGLVKDLAEVNRLLEQAIVNDYVRGEVRVAGFDRGSEYLVLELGSVSAVTDVFLMCKFIFWLQEKSLDVEIKRQWSRSLDIDNDTRETVHKAIRSQLKKDEREALAMILKAGGIPETDHEALARIQHSIKSLKRLMRKGLEVGPVTKTPDEVRALLADAKVFPPIPKQLPARMLHRSIASTYDAVDDDEDDERTE